MIAGSKVWQRGDELREKSRAIGRKQETWRNQADIRKQPEISRRWLEERAEKLTGGWDERERAQKSTL